MSGVGRTIREAVEDAVEALTPPAPCSTCHGHGGWDEGSRLDTGGAHHPATVAGHDRS